MPDASAPRLLAALAPCLLAAACASTIHPLQQPNAREPFGLGTHLGPLAAYSPGRHPDLFPDRAAQLAYWLNAYNAVALRLVLEHYPIGSVREVRTAWWTRLAPAGAGFFYGQRFPLGGRSTSLYEIENRILRRAYREPRIHFALNCASLGCPRLPRRAFDPERLEAQLAEKTTRFLGEARNLRVDAGARAVQLSRIFEWHADDFTAWQRQHGRRPTVLAWGAEHAPPAVAAAAARADAEGCDVRFVACDWRLNDRALGSRPPGPTPD